jgi:hypothetical protein
VPAGDPLSYAVEAEKNLEALATELAKAGADDQTVTAVTQMADTCRKIVGVLGKGQAETSDLEPAAPRSIDEATTALHGDMQAARDR